MKRKMEEEAKKEIEVKTKEIKKKIIYLLPEKKENPELV